MRTCSLVFMVFLLAGCDNDHAPTGDFFCPTPQTVEDFPWVVELINDLGECSTCSSGVVKGTYEGETVIFTMMNDPLCNGIFSGPLYDCRGKVMRNFSPNERDSNDFHNKVSVTETLGQCKGTSAHELGG